MIYYSWKYRKEKYYLNKLKDPINEKSIFIESFNSAKIAGELYYILDYILNNFSDYNIILSINNLKLPEKFNKFSSKIELVKRDSKAYYKSLAKAKIIFTDTTLGLSFIKRKDQILIDYWHGTPIKKMGIHSSKNGQLWNISNIQKIFYLSDLIIFNNEWSKKIFSNDYMMPTLLVNKIKILPTIKNHIRNVKNHSKKTVLFAYTWKTIYRKNPNEFKKILLEIDGYLRDLISENKLNRDDYIFKFSVHNLIYSKKLILWMKKNIEYLVPLKVDDETDEIYQVLSNADIFISDFSSIIFEAAWYNKRIIIDNSEIEKYLDERGIYDEVSNEMKSIENYTSKQKVIEAIFNDEKSLTKYDEFNSKYNSAEYNYNSDNYWLGELLEGRNSLLNEGNISENNNLLIYPGDLDNEEDFFRIKNLLARLLKNEINIILWIPKLSSEIKEQVNAEKIYEEFASLNLNIINSWKCITGSFLDFLNSNPLVKNNKPIFKKRYNVFLKKESKKIFEGLEFRNIVSLSSKSWYANGILRSLEDGNFKDLSHMYKNNEESTKDLSEHIINMIKGGNKNE